MEELLKELAAVLSKHGAWIEAKYDEGYPAFIIETESGERIEQTFIDGDGVVED